ncbi:MAG: 3-isopropylmalate dehydratase small subunit [Akkermansia muciniphila]|nr:3-isopropylmalate dehydratase small subunit [Akkermansia muciniphila]
MPLNKITEVIGKAVPVPGADMDTDRIIPARFLKCITFDELAGTMFYDERFNADGSSKGHPIDAPQHAGAVIILGGENFGCGSSREHAPQAIKRSGIAAVVAESFAEIFFGNSTGIGLPCVCASHDALVQAMRLTEHAPDTAWTLSLADMTLRGGELCLPVRMPEEAREALMQGRWDAVVELMNAPEAVEALAAHMPNPQPH